MHQKLGEPSSVFGLDVLLSATAAVAIVGQRYFPAQTFKAQLGNPFATVQYKVQYNRGDGGENQICRRQILRSSESAKPCRQSANKGASGSTVLKFTQKLFSQWTKKEENGQQKEQQIL